MSNTTKRRERNVCCVTNCRSYREANKWPDPLTFHEFPADLKRRALWLKAIGKEDWIPSDKSKICAMHFTPESYRDLNYAAIAHSIGVNVNNKPLKRLNNTAVPTLHLNLEPLAPPKPVHHELKAADLSSTDPLQAVQLNDPLRSQSPEISKSAPFSQCIVPNCQQYRDTNRWQGPLILFDFPPDLQRRSLWYETLKKNVIGPLPDRGRICSVHFDITDFRDPNKQTLKHKAVPILNLTLPRLEHTIPVISDEDLMQRYKAHYAAYEARKRTTNIIVVDVMKETKKAKLPEKQTFVENDCSQCLQLLKEVRDLECQLFEAKSELREQKKLVESLKSQLGNQEEMIVPS